MMKLCVVLAASILSSMASGQTTAAVAYSPDQLLQLAQQMRETEKRNSTNNLEMCSWCFRAQPH
jgi:hypothetical protein